MKIFLTIKRNKYYNKTILLLKQWEESIMVCEWTGSYTYQPNTTNKCLMDIVCDAIMEYVAENGENHGISITESNAEGWECHGNLLQ